MKLLKILPAGFLAFSGAVALAQGPVTPAPIASNPVVNIQGKVTAVRLAHGFGMPAIEVQSGTGNPVTVWLGSMRYLMQQKFNPSAGEAVEVRGYSVRNSQGEEEIVAITVKLPAANQELKLRDERGFPVWGPGGPAGAGGPCMRQDCNCGHGFRGGTR